MSDQSASVAELQRATLVQKRALLVQEYQALMGKALLTLDPADQARLEVAGNLKLAAIGQIDVALKALDTPALDGRANRAHLAWRQHLHQIDFRAPDRLLRDNVWEPSEGGQCLALLLLPDSHRKCGDLLVERVRRQLDDGGDFRPYQIGFAFGVQPSAGGFLDALGGHLNVAANADLAAHTRAVVDTLVGALLSSSVVLIEAEIMSARRFRAETGALLAWLVAEFWPALAGALQATPNRSYVKVVLAVLAHDADLLAGLDAGIWCAAGQYRADRLFALPLSNWQAGDIAAWLVRYSPWKDQRLPEDEVRARAEELYDASDEGEPRVVRAGLERILSTSEGRE